MATFLTSVAPAFLICPSIQYSSDVAGAAAANSSGIAELTFAPDRPAFDLSVGFRGLSRALRGRFEACLGGRHPAEKGQRLMDVLVERLATFLVELSASELDERFPF